MSQFEYINEIKQTNYTLTGVTDESYPQWNFKAQYSKSTKTIFNDIIYEARTTLAMPTYYVYSEETNDIYIPETQTYVDTTTFDSSKTFENKFIYLDDTDILYEYIGPSPITQHPSTIDFTNLTDWINYGVQLNGYSPQRLYPDTSTLYWKKIQAINSKRAFDNSNTSQTTADGESMVYTFQTSKIDRIALFNLSATQVTIKTHLTTEPESPDNTITTVYDTINREGDHFYEILTATLQTTKLTGYYSIPSASTQEITITITNESGVAALGDITLGAARTLGITVDGLTSDIKDYSTYSSDTEATDEYTEGGYRKSNSFSISFPTVSMDDVQQKLENRRGKITVYNLNPNSSERFYKMKGFIRSRPISYTSNSERSSLSIKIEGRVE